MWFAGGQTSEPVSLSREVLRNKAPPVGQDHLLEASPRHSLGCGRQLPPLGNLGRVIEGKHRVHGIMLAGGIAVHLQTACEAEQQRSISMTDARVVGRDRWARAPWFEPA